MEPSIQSLGFSRFGVATYFKAPRVRPDGDWSADVAFLGVPFDQGTGFRPGTRFGPKSMRDMSMRYSLITADPPGVFDIRRDRQIAQCRIVDCGDVDILPLVWRDNFDRMTHAVTRVLDHGAVPFVVGGDHAVTFPIFRAYEGRGPITIVHFDAHLDYRYGVPGKDDPNSGLRYGHGNVLRRVRELDCVEHLVSIGIRSLRHIPRFVRDFLDHGNTMICPWQIMENGVDHFQDQLPRGKDVYITFDIDGMDAALVPGTGTPEVGGLTYEQARRFLELVATQNRVVGFDMVEVNPLYDPMESTALLATQLIVETLGFMYPG